jgi:tetratricopeptide (TPR) repeat protein
MAVAVPAFAQAPSPYPAACDASKVSKVDVERAHTVFLSGKGFLDESNYDKAISYFKDAYSIDCSVHGILPIIATAYERKGDKAEAIRALGEYILRVPNTPDREVIERRIRNLREQLAQEKATATATTTAPTATATAVPTGTTTAPTGEPTATAPPTATSTGGAPPPSTGAHSVAPWIVVGAGGALVVTGALLLASGSGKVSSANNACPSHLGCPQSVADMGNSGRSLEAVGIVAGIAGIVAVGAGLVWHFTESGSAPATATTRGTTLTPVVTPGFAGMSFGGSF